MRAKYLTLLIVSLALLQGCDNTIKDAVREKLKDPYSAKFEQVLKISNFACVRYNAKNSYGAFEGLKTAHLEDLGSGNWYVTIDEAEDCSLAALEKKLSIYAADKRSEKEILEILKSKKLVPTELTDIRIIENARCRDFVSDIMINASLAHSASEGDEGEWQKKYSAGLERLRGGDCTSEVDRSAHVDEAALAEAIAAAKAAAAVADALQ